jgi:hypothetical protein
MLPHEIYCNLMHEAKIRLLATERVSCAARSISGVTSCDDEFCFLQIRKIIELITFAAMVSEEERYRKFREGERKRDTDHIDPAADWNATEILSKLVKLSPYALPRPLGGSLLNDRGVQAFEGTKLVVNHSKLIELYKNCSKFIHCPNPLLGDFSKQVVEQRAKYTKASGTVRDALIFLRNLLWFHVAVQLAWTDKDDPRSLDGPKSSWIVNFGEKDDDPVTVAVGVAVGPDS